MYLKKKKKIFWVGVVIEHGLFLPKKNIAQNYKKVSDEMPFQDR